MHSRVRVCPGAPGWDGGMSGLRNGHLEASQECDFDDVVGFALQGGLGGEGGGKA